jgi:hypothetical protein
VQWINGSLTCYARKNGGRREPIPCNEKTISNEEDTMPISEMIKNFTGSVCLAVPCSQEREFGKG